MRFKEHNCKKVDFPGAKITHLPSATTLIKSFHKPVIINALPAHPYDFPQVHLFLELLEKNHHIINTVKEKYNIPGLLLLINKKWKQAVHQKARAAKGNLRIIYKKPVYPLTDKCISFMTGVKECKVIGWYQFLMIVAREKNMSLPGIPVSLSFPEKKIRTHMLVPKNTSVGEIIKAAGFTPDDTMICTDHPFRGILLHPETKVEAFNPHTFIIFPKNIRQNPSLWLKIKFMVCGYCSFSFSDTFDSRPNQLHTPCQKCLYCTKICPAGIVPFMLSTLYTAENIKGASKHSPELCIECGLCSYICPSGISLLHNIKRLKKELGVST